MLLEGENLKISQTMKTNNHTLEMHYISCILTAWNNYDHRLTLLKYYQPSGAGVTHSLVTACNAAPPAKSKMAAREPQNGPKFLGTPINFH